jgi:peptidase M23-like protein
VHLLLSLLLAWTPPVSAEPTKLFHLGPNPFLRGQHRGVDFAGDGARVRAACAGRVVFAGQVAGAGTVSVRCGRWRVSYAPLTRIAVHEGKRIGAGARLGRSVRGLHFGVRREGQRFGYVDPLRFLAADRRAPPLLGRPPKGIRRARAPARSRPLPTRPHAVSRPAATVAPWPVWLGLTLLLTGLVGAGRLRLPYRRLGGAPCRASSTSNSSPTNPSSP